MAVVILDQMQVLDEQIAPARPIDEERLHLLKRLRIDLAALGRARRPAPTALPALARTAKPAAAQSGSYFLANAGAAE